MAVYRGTKPHFPNYGLYVVDGSVGRRRPRSWVSGGLSAVWSRRCCRPGCTTARATSGATSSTAASAWRPSETAASTSGGLRRWWRTAWCCRAARRCCTGGPGTSRPRSSPSADPAARRGGAGGAGRGPRWQDRAVPTAEQPDADQPAGNPAARGEDARLDEALQQLLDARPATASICPSEVARAVGGEEWRELMEPARAAARRLVAEGRAEITQGGRVVDPATARGPIRIRRPR
nr:DUF3253 domain-containing protein [Auraticoccus cholistanensis]